MCELFRAWGGGVPDRTYSTKKSASLSPSADSVRHNLETADRAAACGRRSTPHWGDPSMAKFLFVYRSNPASFASMAPEEIQQTREKWRAWITEGMSKGWMLDPGDALNEEGKVVTAKVVTDGPFVESKEVLGGYSVVQADSIEAAAKHAKGCPGLLYGGSVEVRQLAGYTI